MSTPWPFPFPQPVPRAFDFDFDAFFAGVQAHVQESRAILGQSPLIPRGEILVGQEQLPQNFAPPVITVIPRGFRYVPARHFGANFVPKPIWSWWLDLEVHCWGDDDPSGTSALYSFSSAAELARQFLTALALAAGGPARVQPGASEWVQLTDVNRLGRILVIRPSFERHVNLDPPILVPVATSTTGGAVIDITANLTSPDATSTISEAVFAVP